MSEPDAWEMNVELKLSCCLPVRTESNTQFSPRGPCRDDFGHDAPVVPGDVGQPSTPGGISQGVEPVAFDADRL